MLTEVFDIVFGCNHRFAFPIRLRGTDTPYQVCIQCGAEYEYDWKRMRRLGLRKQKRKAYPALQQPKAA